MIFLKEHGFLSFWQRHYIVFLKFFALILFFFCLNHTANNIYAQGRGISFNDKAIADSLNYLLTNQPDTCISYADQLLRNENVSDALFFEIIIARAEAFSRIPKFDSALVILLKLEKNPELKLTASEKYNLNNTIGKVYAQAGDLLNAENRFIQSLNIAIELDDSLRMAKMYNNLGNIKSNTGEIENALQYYKTAFTMKKAANDLETLGNTLINIGNLYSDLCNFDSAGLYYEYANKFVSIGNDPFNYAVIKLNKAANLLNLGQAGDAEKCLDSCMLIAQNFGFTMLLPGVYYNYSELYKLHEDYEKALEYFHRFNKVNDSLRNFAGADKLQWVKKSLEADQQKQELNRLIAEKEIRNLEANRERRRTFFILFSTLLFLIFAIAVYYEKNKRLNWLSFLTGSKKSRLFTGALILTANYVLYYFVCCKPVEYPGNAMEPEYINQDGFLQILLKFMVNFLIASVGLLIGILSYFFAERLKNKPKNIYKQTSGFIANKQFTDRTNEYAENNLTLTGRNKNEYLTIPAKSFVFAKAEDNYVSVHYLNHGILEKVLIRNTLAEIEKQVYTEANIKRCHRSYILHTIHIKEIKGNAKKACAVLTVSGTHLIPLSEKFRIKFIEDNL